MEAIAIIKNSNIPKLSNGQMGVYKAINKCVSEKSTLTMDDIVNLYCKFVRPTYNKENRQYKNIDIGGGKVDYRSVHIGYTEYDINDEYKKCSAWWTYTFKPLIKQWFVNNIGILVLKGMLNVLPTIKIED